MWKKGGLALAAGVALTGCATQKPSTVAAVKTQTGLVLVGKLTEAGGTFEFIARQVNGPLECSGGYNARALGDEASRADITCTDGRAGTVDIRFYPSWTGGEGVIHFGDGTIALLALGETAETVVRSSDINNLSPRVR